MLYKYWWQTFHNIQVVIFSRVTQHSLISPIRLTRLRSARESSSLAWSVSSSLRCLSCSAWSSSISFSSWFTSSRCFASSFSFVSTNSRGSTEYQIQTYKFKKGLSNIVTKCRKFLWILLFRIKYSPYIFGLILKILF